MAKNKNGDNKQRSGLPKPRSTTEYDSKTFKPKRNQESYEGEDEDEDMINIDRIQGRVKSGTFRKISEVIDKHPDEALGVLRRWMMAA